MKFKPFFKIRRLECFGVFQAFKVAVKYIFGWGSLQKNPVVPAFVRRHPVYVKDRCVACKLCVQTCPTKAIKVRTSKTENGFVPDNFTLDRLRCVSCGLCVESCPTDALYLSDKKGEEYACD